MKIDLRKSTLSTAVIISLYAIFRIVRQCCLWSGIHFWLHHPIRGHMVGHGIDLLMDVCIAIFLLAVLVNRNRLPELSGRWKVMRNILVFSLGYLMIFQMQMICNYPLWCSRIFYHTLWLIPIVYVGAIWLFAKQSQTTETYTLSPTRASLVLWTAILLMAGVFVGMVLMALWYMNTTEWLDKWHWRIPLLIKVISELIFILFLTFKNK